ncbi:phage holin, LLH family [Heliorestis convoluta]|uniref:Phage holin, LL-H family n=1 Tax=Heliorestis convoluta TaxID=356322 RepID=A0A5Q2N169_9FIRM|nr:phage holin, LLH family [Heliorestis convoluta]QGG47549.1 hypothetical protein FTV88_1402 [Heliorestis convoluta]
MPYGDLMVIALYIMIFGLIAIVTFVIRNFGPSIVEYINSKTTEQQRELLAFLARSAVLFARNRFGHLSGQEQFTQAIDYFNKALVEKGIPISREEMEGLLELAYEEAKKAGLLQSLSKKIDEN